MSTLLTPRELSALISSIVMMVGTCWYIFQILKKDAVYRPVLASWIVLGGTTTLSFATYWTTPHHSLVSNACAATSILSTGSIMLAVLYLTKGRKTSFTRFQKWSLLFSGIIAIFWIILVWGLNRTGLVPYILTC